VPTTPTETPEATTPPTETPTDTSTETPTVTQSQPWRDRADRHRDRVARLGWSGQPRTSVAASAR
jgi:hypothetical protein